MFGGEPGIVFLQCVHMHTSLTRLCTHPHFVHTHTHTVLSLQQPERINLQPTQKGYDVRADIWSLGISLVELANGTSPYTTFSNEFQLLTHIVNAPPPLPDEKQFSPLFYDFVSKWYVYGTMS